MTVHLEDLPVDDLYTDQVFTDHVFALEMTRRKIAERQRREMETRIDRRIAEIEEEDRQETLNKQTVRLEELPDDYDYLDRLFQHRNTVPRLRIEPRTPQRMQQEYTIFNEARGAWGDALERRAEAETLMTQELTRQIAEQREMFERRMKRERLMYVFLSAIIILIGYAFGVAR